MAEKPTMEETPKEPEIQTEGLLEELKALNITEPGQIQDIVHASQQTGKAWNEVGELRSQVAQLQEQLATQPVAQEYEEGQPVDIMGLVKKGIREVIQTDIVGPQKQATEAYYRQMDEITRDPDYSNATIQKIWNEYQGSPAFQRKMQQGGSLLGEWNTTVRTYYREVAGRSEKAIRGLTEQKGKTPYVEQGETRAMPEMPPADERKEAANKIDKQRRDGTMSSADALRSMIDNYLPKTDPIWRQE